MSQEEVLRIIDKELITFSKEMEEVFGIAERNVRKALSKIMAEDNIVQKITIQNKVFYIKNGLYRDLFENAEQGFKEPANRGQGYCQEWCVLNNLQGS